ncbi:XRE family transcriptional regulator [Lapidilactobacillus wuchangensis]|uniref:XRE family transcriptional regulator n=1 Tax=Lapidilactobacillus wuchangensis TaxID=2486001 RepID=UPI000F793FF6|nr:XRE family transcriptional regulator [Lapidilactobacillus wuchangensis]
MPTTLPGRELIKKYIDQNSISVASLGRMYGVGKMYMGEVLSGKKSGPSANALILKIIDDLKIVDK